MKQLIAYIFVIILIGIACTKQEWTADTNTLVLSDTQLAKLAIANQVGEDHNKALDYLASHSDLHTVTDEQKFHIISDFFISISETDKQKDAFIAAKKQGCSSCRFDYRSISEWINVNKSKLSEKEIGYMLEMEKTLELYNTVGTEKVIDALQGLEKRIVTDAQLTRSSMLLGTSAILRYSIKYWHDAFFIPQHPYYAVVNQDVTSRDICSYCITVALVDAFSYSDCLSNGGFGTWEVAENVCTGQAAYASAQYY